MPNNHYQDVKVALSMYKHVLCESPFSLKKEEALELVQLAKDNNCILMDGIKRHIQQPLIACCYW